MFIRFAIIFVYMYLSKYEYHQDKFFVCLFQLFELETTAVK